MTDEIKETQIGVAQMPIKIYELVKDKVGYRQKTREKKSCLNLRTIDILFINAARCLHFKYFDGDRSSNEKMKNVIDLHSLADHENLKLLTQIIGLVYYLENDLENPDEALIKPNISLKIVENLLLNAWGNTVNDEIDAKKMFDDISPNDFLINEILALE